MADPTAESAASALAVELPPSLFEAVRAELRRAFQAPYEAPIVVAVNGLLAAGLWYLVPPSISDAMFSIHGSFMFPIVLAIWMFSDVPATNEIADDPVRMAAALDDWVMVERMLRAKHLVLWLLISPFALLAAVLIGFSSHDQLSAMLTIAWVLCVPFSMLGLSCYVGIRWPYNPITLKERWAERRRWPRMWLRWGLLVISPYGIVPMLGLISLLPFVVASVLDGATKSKPLGDLHFGLATGVSIAIGLVVWGLATRWMAQRAVHRAEELRSFMADPLRG